MPKGESTTPEMARAAGKASYAARVEKFKIADAARELCRRTREAQGLPPTITDVDVLAKIASIMLGGGSDSTKPC
jgi:hypothetical protein